MFIYGKKTMTQISMCSRNKHMSTGGGLSALYLRLFGIMRF